MTNIEAERILMNMQPKNISESVALSKAINALRLSDSVKACLDKKV